MTRQADKTLLASLGFADKDKRDPRHDEICQFIALHAEEVVNKIAKTPGWSVTDVQLEYLLTKGIGQYKTHVGFVDVFVEAEKEDKTWRNIYFEVKVSLCSINEIIRQLKLYRSYNTLHNMNMVLVTHFDVTEDQKTLLKREGIIAVHTTNIGFTTDAPSDNLFDM